MSYILDALTKSQREREQATVPHLGTQYTALGSAERPRAIWSRLAYLVASVAVAVAFYAVFARTPPLSDAVAPAGPAPELAVPQMITPTSAQGPEPVAALALSSDLSPPASNEDGPRPLPSASEPTLALVIGANEPSLSVASAPAPPVTKSLVSAQTALPKKMLPPPPVPTSESSPAAATLSGGIPLPEKTPVERKERLASLRAELLALKDEEESPAAVHPATANITSERLESDRTENERETESPAAVRPAGQSRRPATLTLWQLPPNARAGIPDLRLNAHIYAKEPNERLAIINMRRYQEGDRTSEGAIVEMITPEGAELRFAAQRFRLSLSR